MKIAVLGSAPSSVYKAPFGDTSWEIWACSPGSYPVLGRIDQFWEVHRWEPGVVGKPNTQKPWFTPEYVQWLATVPPVLWLADPEALKANPNNGKMLPTQALVLKYGSYVWTSSVAYMAAMAIEKIIAARQVREAEGKPAEVDVIGFWGVDMAANEELYSGQRSACQFFIQVMTGLGIEFFIPPESDLATPPPMYGVSEVSHKAIKWLERRRELEARLAQTNAQCEQLRNQSFFIQGAIDDCDYMQKMWLFEGDETVAFDFQGVFPEIAAGRAALAVKPATASAVMDSAAVEAQSAPASAPTPPIDLAATQPS